MNFRRNELQVDGCVLVDFTAGIFIYLFIFCLWGFAFARFFIFYYFIFTAIHFALGSVYQMKCAFVVAGWTLF